MRNINYALTFSRETKEAHIISHDAAALWPLQPLHQSLWAGLWNDTTAECLKCIKAKQEVKIPICVEYHSTTVLGSDHIPKTLSLTWLWIPMIWPISFQSRSLSLGFMLIESQTLPSSITFLWSPCELIVPDHRNLSQSEFNYLLRSFLTWRVTSGARMCHSEVVTRIMFLFELIKL